MAARIDSDRFNNWQQEKPVSQKIHEKGQEQVKKSKTTAQKTLDTLAQAKNVDASNEAAAKAQANSAARAPAEQRASQPLVQATRPETQHEGAKQEAVKVQGQQEQSFQKAKTEVNQSKAHSAGQTQTVTRNAVSSPAQTPQANISQNPQQSTFTLAQPASRLPQQSPKVQSEAVAKSVDPKKLTSDKEQVRQGDGYTQVVKPEKAVTRAAVEFAAGASKAGVATHRETSEKGKKNGEKERTSTKKTASGKAGIYDKSGELERLIDGEGGLSADAGGSGEEEAIPQLDEIPAEYNSRVVFNEQSDLNTVQEKNDILNRYVLKNERIEQIKNLNESVDKKLRDVFADQPLSERLSSEVGEARDILRKLYHGSLTNFYGGSRG